MVMNRNKNDEFYIASLLEKKLQGTLSEDEEVFIQNWLSENGNNQRIFDQLQNQELLIRKFDQYSSIDTKGSWEKLEKKLPGSKQVFLFGTVLKYAASILIPLIAGAIYYLFV